MAEEQAKSTEGGEQEKPRDLWRDVIEEAGLESIEEVPLGVEFFWGKNGRWQSDGRVPLDGLHFLKIAAIFQSADEVRVYAMPHEQAPKAAQGEMQRPTVPHRLTLNKYANTHFIEVIPSYDTLVETIGRELRDLNEDSEAEYAQAILEQARDLIGEDKVNEACELIMADAEEDEDEDDEKKPNGAVTATA